MFMQKSTKRFFARIARGLLVLFALGLIFLCGGLWENLHSIQQKVSTVSDDLKQMDTSPSAILVDNNGNPKLIDIYVDHLMNDGSRITYPAVYGAHPDNKALRRVFAEWMIINSKPTIKESNLEWNDKLRIYEFVAEYIPKR